MTETSKSSANSSKTTNHAKLDKIKVELVPVKTQAKLAQDDTGVPVKHSNEDNIEINGPRGLEPTRYGDWESKGRCCDF